MKKPISIILSALMFFVLLTACGGEKEQDQEAAPAPQEQTEYPDYSGYEFIFRSFYMGNFLPNLVNGTTELIGDYQQQQFDDTEKVFKCTITPVQEEYGALEKKLAAMAATGESDTDFVYSLTDTMKGWYEAGITIDIKSLNGVGIDLTNTEKWGSPSLQASVTHPDGALFAIPYVGSYYWPQFFSYDCTVLVNDEIIIQNNMTSPQELNEQKSWTFDTFKEMLPAYTLKDGDNIIYGASLYSVGGPTFAYGAILANGGTFVEDKNGTFTFTLNSEATRTALDWAREVYGMTDNVTDNTNHANTVFSGGNATLYITNAWRGLARNNDWEIQNTLNDISWMPFPYGPNAVYGKTNGNYTTGATDGMAIINGEKPEETAIVMDYLFNGVEQLGDEGFMGYLRDYYFHDQDSFEVYKSQVINSYVIRADLLTNEGMTTINEAITAVLKGETSPAEALNGLNDAMQANIDMSVAVSK